MSTGKGRLVRDFNGQDGDQALLESCSYIESLQDELQQDTHHMSVEYRQKVAYLRMVSFAYRKLIVIMAVMIPTYNPDITTVEEIYWDAVKEVKTMHQSTGAMIRCIDYDQLLEPVIRAAMVRHGY